MASTLIHTAECIRTKLDDNRGDVAEIINNELCGAKDVTSSLRWLEDGQHFDTASLPGTHQLIYLIEGNGKITLEGKDYALNKGAGVYLGPMETAAISQRGGIPTKFLHIIVPIKN
jgi:glyoxylate utilization-related uncharacterized protein